MTEQRKSETERKPTLRFKGFTDPWEQRKVGDFLTESRELGASGNVARKLTVKLWGKGVMEKSGVVGSEHTQYYVRRSGQFIYSKLDFLNAAFGVIPDQLNGFESTADLPAFDVKNLNANFLLLRATQKSFYLTFGMVADGSRKAKRVHANTFLEMPLLVPCVEEQCAIAALFARLDSLITLHQRKVDKLKTVKQSLLDRMFPKEGESVPELRFAGFTDPWEQRKVGDFLTESRELGASGNVARKLTVKLWGKGVMEKSGVVGSEHTQYYVRRSGQFIYSKLDFLNAAFGVIPDQLNGFESTADLPAFDVKNLNANFLLLRATQKSFYLTFGMVADGSRKAKRVHANTFLEMPLLVPCVEEQCAIAALFARLDSLITLHQREGRACSVCWLRLALGASCRFVSVSALG